MGNKGSSAPRPKWDMESGLSVRDETELIRTYGREWIKTMPLIQKYGELSFSVTKNRELRDKILQKDRSKNKGRMLTAMDMFIRESEVRLNKQCSKIMPFSDSSSSSSSYDVRDLSGPDNAGCTPSLLHTQTLLEDDQPPPMPASPPYDEQQIGAVGGVPVLPAAPKSEADSVPPAVLYDDAVAALDSHVQQYGQKLPLTPNSLGRGALRGRGRGRGRVEKRVLTEGDEYEEVDMEENDTYASKLRSGKAKENSPIFTGPYVQVMGTNGPVFVHRPWSRPELQKVSEHLPRVTSGGEMMADAYLDFCKECSPTAAELRAIFTIHNGASAARKLDGKWMTEVARESSTWADAGAYETAVATFCNHLRTVFTTRPDPGKLYACKQDGETVSNFLARLEKDCKTAQ
nr:uncharacterized protein LOC129442642 [Misgurnus anguillicaudatus]